MANRQWTDFEMHVLQEHIKDFQDGMITRRELLKRLTLTTGSLALTVALLPVLGCNIDQPRAGASPTAPAVPSATAASIAFAVPPAARTTDGMTVRPDDPRITVVAADVKGPDRASLGGYLARPKAEGLYAGVLVVQEDGGVTPHIRDVVRRVATAGFAAITVDLLAREGGAERIDAAQYPARLSARSPEALVADLRAALLHLRGSPFVNRDRLGAVGFGFGGGMVWHLFPSNYTAVLSAAVPFYGPPPPDVSVLAGSKASAFAVYAEKDTAITATRAQVEEQLKRGGLPYRIAVYPGVDHGFHDDTSERYDADQAQKAWISTIDWFRKYLV